MEGGFLQKRDRLFLKFPPPPKINYLIFMVA